MLPTQNLPSTKEENSLSLAQLSAQRYQNLSILQEQRYCTLHRTSGIPVVVLRGGGEQVFIKTTQSQKVIPIEVDLETDTIENIKLRIAGLMRIPVDEQELFFNKKKLKNKHLLHEYHIRGDSALFLIIRLRGG